MIETHSLSKRYGSQLAVDAVSFACPPGTVTGFLGPNGAGKSTTLRMICGLTPPSHGHATVSGRSYQDLPNPGRRVGVLLDASAQHAGRTGREVLALSARLIGVPPSRVDQVLELVGLPPSAAGKRVRGYSLGMRQRLGIAHALLADPSVLILDEPANGLDPEGIRWMRDLLRAHADAGGTVLLSSHLLLEVEALADRLVMISGGRVVAQGDKRDLLAGSGGVLVRAADRAGLDAALRRAGIAASPTADGALLARSQPQAVGLAAAAAGVPLTELRQAGDGRLEELFLHLTHQTLETDETGTPQRHRAGGDAMILEATR
jgi:ABC-2 type transport system ATP-binding protein